MKRLELKIHPPVVAGTLLFFSWLLSYFFKFFQSQFELNKAVAFVFFLFGLLLGATGVITFWKFSTTTKPNRPEEASKLVSTGVYKYSRNPMYLGLLFILLGWGFFLNNYLAIVIPPILFVLYITNFQIKPEERILGKQFGEEYESYKKTTKRWLGW